jgi:hypothetical protein
MFSAERLEKSGRPPFGSLAQSHCSTVSSVHDHDSHAA